MRLAARRSLRGLGRALAVAIVVAIGAWSATTAAQVWKPRTPHRASRVAPPPRSPSTKPPAPRARPRVVAKPKKAAPPRRPAADDYIIIEEDGEAAPRK